MQYNNKNCLFIDKGLRSEHIIGCEMTYVKDHDYRFVCEIPEEIAHAWLTEAGYLFKDNKGRYQEWLNKAGYVVRVESNSVFCLYNHDEVFSLREKTFK